MPSAGAFRLFSLPPSFFALGLAVLVYDYFTGIVESTLFSEDPGQWTEEVN